MFLRWSPGGTSGSDLHTADNPDFGVTFAYYVDETLRTREAARQAEERRAQRRGDDTPYPTWEELAEELAAAPRVFLTVRDADGNVVNTVNGSASRGMRRATWNYRYPGYNPVAGAGGFGGGGGNGPMALPGSYAVSLSRRVIDASVALATCWPRIAVRRLPSGPRHLSPATTAAWWPAPVPLAFRSWICLDRLGWAEGDRVFRRAAIGL
ncbi:hypothetical protein [Candidatus Palauibacter sp.]|uniref:hypothetical protein n=1 Tax=Candidatus Palauibacter sp. TaxID=3101350 RepID=UPI003B018AD5